MALSVGLHVTLAHSGDTRHLSGRPWQVPVYGGFLLAAAVLRALCDFDRVRFLVWLGSAAAFFLAASLVETLVVPRCSTLRARTKRSGDAVQRAGALGFASALTLPAGRPAGPEGATGPRDLLPARLLYFGAAPTA